MPDPNPTLATADKVRSVLQDAEDGVTRYAIFQRLEGSVNYTVIDSVLDYFAELDLVADEGKGGKVTWTGRRHTATEHLDAGPHDLFRDMPPSEVPRDNLDRLIRAPTRTSYRMWRDRSPEERLRASFSLTAFASKLGEGRRRDART